MDGLAHSNSYAHRIDDAITNDSSHHCSVVGNDFRRPAMFGILRSKFQPVDLICELAPDGIYR